jgi:hypothetical protein
MMGESSREGLRSAEISTGCPRASAPNRNALYPNSSFGELGASWRTTFQKKVFATRGRVAVVEIRKRTMTNAPSIDTHAAGAVT